MTTVRFYVSGGEFVGFEVTGHTGYAEEGSDIVCSAVSALTQTAVIGLTEVLKLPSAVEIKQARLYFMLESGLDENSRREAQILFQTLRLGLGSIADTYGTYLKLVEKEVSHNDAHQSAAVRTQKGRRQLPQRP
ncbi:MAG TPA: ribosomal-processing cysteine protease Prp [Clostridia bacterium]|nr:ribosomal-processing cysteine protease Prp [Clostridia bacterium]